MQTVYRNHIPGDWMLDPMDVLYIAKGDVTSGCTSHREAMNEMKHHIGNGASDEHIIHDVQDVEE